MLHDRQKTEGRSQTREMFTVAINLLLGSIVILFFGLTYGYLFHMGQNWLEFDLPKIFWLSTIAILAVSFLMQRLLIEYDRDNQKNLKRLLFSSLLFAALFVYCQVSGWLMLYANGIELGTSPSASYLYVLTGLHVLHVLVGIIFLVVSNYRVYFRTADEVKALIFFSDPVRRTRLKLMRNYWHTIDFVWLFLFFVFLYMHA
jgi:cytochrome c oxidase subunit 3